MIKEFTKKKTRQPVGWETKTLEDVCVRIFAGGDKPKEFSKFKTEKFTIPIYANGEKNKGLYGYTDEAKVLEPSITISGRGTIGYSEIRNEPFTPIVRLIVLKPNKEDVDIKFLKNIVSNLDFINSGSSIPQLTVPMVKGYTFSLPPLHQQKQIVAILDQAFAAIDTAKANAAQNLQNVKELFESYLQNVFENKGDDWEEKTLGEVCKIIGGGTPSKKREDFYTGNILWATVRDMTSEIIKNTQHKITTDAVKNSSTNIIPKGNVIIATRVGLGKVCLLEKDSAINQDLKAVIPKKDTMLSISFLFRWFTSISEKIINEGTGATVQGVKLTFINSLPISIPLMKEQKEIVQKLNALSSETKKLESIYTQKLADLEEIKKSILEKAFSGKLAIDNGILTA